MKNTKNNCTIAVDSAIFSFGNQGAAAIRKKSKVNFSDIISQVLKNGICYNGNTYTVEDFLNEETSNATSFIDTFEESDWVVGVPNTLTIPQSTHNLEFVENQPVIYKITVIDSNGDSIEISSFTINQTNGDVTIRSAVVFDGIIRIDV